MLLPASWACGESPVSWNIQRVSKSIWHLVGAPWLLSLYKSVTHLPILAFLFFNWIGKNQTMRGYVFHPLGTTSSPPTVLLPSPSFAEIQGSESACSLLLFLILWLLHDCSIHSVRGLKIERKQKILESFPDTESDTTIPLSVLAKPTKWVTKKGKQVWVNTPYTDSWFKYIS